MPRLTFHGVAKGEIWTYLRHILNWQHVLRICALAVLLVRYFVYFLMFNIMIKIQSCEN